MNPENTRLNAMPSFRANDDEMLFDIFVVHCCALVFSMKIGCHINTIRLWFVIQFQKN